MKCTVKTPNRANIDNSETTIWSIFAVNSWEQNKINTRKRKAKSEKLGEKKIYCSKWVVWEQTIFYKKCSFIIKKIFSVQ